LISTASADEGYPLLCRLVHSGQLVVFTVQLKMPQVLPQDGWTQTLTTTRENKGRRCDVIFA